MPNTPLSDAQRLKEMGIATWIVRDNTFFSAKPQAILLPNECKLLFISDSAPQPSQLEFFNKILRTLSLTVEQAYFLPLEAVLAVKNLPVLCWFAAVTPLALTNTHILHSDSLINLEQNIEQKKILWQQIKTYVNATCTP